MGARYVDAMVQTRPTADHPDPGLTIGAAAWSTRVQTELRRRLASWPATLLADAQDLAGLVSPAPPGPPGLATPSEPAAADLEVVASVGALTDHADLAAAIRGVEAALAPGGTFLFLEPVGRPGWRGLLEASAGAHLAAVRGRHVGRDVPAAVRASGLLICDLERFEIATAAWPLRHWVQARALKTRGLRGLDPDLEPEPDPEPDPDGGDR